MILFIFFFLQFHYITASNILVIFDNALYSHEIICKTLLLKLAENGHSLTVFSTFLDFPNNENITRHSFEPPDSAVSEKLLKGKELRSLVDVEKQFIKYAAILKNHTKHPEIQKFFIEQPKFDLILTESALSPLMSIAKLSNCPIVLMFATFIHPAFYEAVIGNYMEPAVHRNVDIVTGIDGKLSFFERLFSFIEQIFIGRILVKFAGWRHERILKQQMNDFDDFNFSIDVFPKIDFIISATKIMSYFGRIYPVLPHKNLQIHSTHLKALQEIRKIDENLLEFLESSKKEIILISFGTIVQLDQLTVNLTSIFLSTIQELSSNFNFIWKIGKKDKISSTESLFVSSWLPNMEILKNSKVKLFINHGGTRSIEEAINCKVPMISIPIFLDHFINSEFIEIGGISKTLKLSSLKNHKILVNAIKEMNENFNFYNKNIENLNEIVKDKFESDLIRQPYKPDPKLTSIILQMAVYLKFRLNMLQTIVSVSCCFIYRNNFANILQNFEDIDRKLNKLNFYRNYSSDINSSFLIYILYSCYNSGLFLIGLIRQLIFDVKLHKSVPLSNPFFLYALFLNGYVALTFAIILAAINSRVENIDQIIQKSKIIKNMNVKEIMKIYSKIFDSLQLCCQCFASILIASHGGNVMNYLFMMFSGFTAYVKNFELSNVIVFYGFFLFILTNLGNQLAIYYFSSILRKNCRNIWKNLSLKVQNLKFSQLVSYQISHSELSASCGLYDFEWKIYMAIIVAAFNYTIVCIQFDMEN